MRYVSLLIISLLIGCSPKQEMEAGSIDPELQPFLTEFLAQAEKHGRNVNNPYLVMGFSDQMPSENAVGYCVFKAQPFIYIKPGYFNSLDKASKEELIFHELGHCLLGLKHNDNVETAHSFLNGSPTSYNIYSSIMNKYAFGGIAYSGNREEYVKRLFTGFISSILYYNGPNQMNDLYE